MLIQLLLTGLAGLALGIVIMRLIPSWTKGKGADANAAVDGDGQLDHAVVDKRSGITQTQLILVAAAGLAALAVGIIVIKPDPSPEAAKLAPAIAQGGGPDAAKLDDVDTMISRLEARLKENPTDGEGFRMLGWSFQNTGKSAEAVLAYANAAKLLPKRADVHAGYGEALVAVAGDKVTAEAKSHFDEALRLDPKEPRARFFASLYKAQNGNERAALDEWIALSKSAGPDQPWQADVRQRIARLAEKLGVDVSTRLIPLPGGAPMAGGPSPAQMAAARTLPVDQQQSMIDGMVNGLAAKLRRNPDDVDGWLKLIRSRVVLKDSAGAERDLAMARKTFAMQPAKLARINTLATELAL
jgi:cytochrome c-type biogenesis protein CcmH